MYWPKETILCLFYSTGTFHEKVNWLKQYSSNAESRGHNFVTTTYGYLGFTRDNFLS